MAGHHGIIALGNDTDDGVGVIGVGNNEAYSLPPTGCGGAFTGEICGVYGFATKSNQERYGGYFATNGDNYAYVGGRVGNTNCKIIGTGNVNTIVKSAAGERITLTCPEAPETLFMDFGVGQLENGNAHIEIDPDLSINILVDEDHPLKVIITPEGDCNGLYVTNKSAEGFDVAELGGGTSNVAFSWQIVATRASEYETREDGTTVMLSDYSERFPPAPGPLEEIKKDETSKSTLQFGQMEILTTEEAVEIGTKKK
jgi:hypothetical protein